VKNALEKRNTGRANLDVTFLGFGALEIGRDWGIGEDQTRPSAEKADKVLNSVLDAGINIVDTASAYHKSERRIGKFISHRRDEYHLSTKCGEHNDEPNTYYDFSYEAVKKSINQSLHLLNTDYIDIMFIHFGPNSEKVIAKGETLRAMQEAQSEGKIKYLGASIDGELAKRCIESGNFDFMEMHYNILDQDNSENIKLCEKNDIGVFIRGALGRGRLTAKVLNLLKEDPVGYSKERELLELVDNDPTEMTKLALNFLYRHEGISSVLIGTKNPSRIRENIELIKQKVDRSLLKEASKIGKS